MMGLNNVCKNWGIKMSNLLLEGKKEISGAIAYFDRKFFKYIKHKDCDQTLVTEFTKFRTVVILKWREIAMFDDMVLDEVEERVFYDELLDICCDLDKEFRRIN